MIIRLTGSPIGRNLRFLRKAWGLNRSTFANIMNISTESVVVLEEEFDCLFTDTELHNWCRFFQITEKMLIEADLAQLFQQKPPAP